MTSYSRPKTASPLQLLRWALSRKEPVHVSWRAILDPAMAAFGMRFFLSGPQTEKKISETTQITDQLAGASGRLLDVVREENGLRTAVINGGLLMFFEDPKKLQALIA